MDELLGWVNGDAKKMGAEPVEGHTVAWHAANGDRVEKLRQMMEAKARNAR